MQSLFTMSGNAGTAYTGGFGRIWCENRQSVGVQTLYLANGPVDVVCDWLSYTSADVAFPIRYNTSMQPMRGEYISAMLRFEW